MTGRLDRSMQRRLLEMCAEEYPRDGALLDFLKGLDDEAELAYAANIAYLEEHDLVESKLQIGADGHFSFGLPRITARGMDFLADDGGLSAILGAVTVKLHADTIRDMLLAKAEASALPAPEKTALRKQIEGLPASALQAATSRLMQEGLAHVPDLLHWVRTYIGL